MTKCPKCGYKNRAGVELCGGCGQPLIAKKTCPQCGHANPQGNKFCGKCGHSLVEPAPETRPPSPEPTSFANGRYEVKKLLGEGGKKKVYLVHDTFLDRDVAFALIKTERLDDASRTRFTREARAMGRLGDHPNIMTIYDIGDYEGQPYIVIPVMHGGDVEGLIDKAPEHRLPVEQAVGIAKAICRGLQYAHGKGIIHRDIKPGNVWLSADGTVKIGDFGLALAVDLSRLTEEGMIVGTAFYMPPEQAMGCEVTPKSDLYSLGIMLYEMVTGRPPFVGDTSVAVITQHIDTSLPISPTWHRADLPPGLEALIMQLLEKDPEKRPVSAADVLRSLETIDSGEVSEAPIEEVPTIDRGPLYRRVFVGRETELKQLQSAFDAAASGNGSLTMVVGEPGIGKTAICEQLSTYATVRGGKYLIGHCYEEGSLSLPYLAFVEAMRSYVIDRETRDLRKELGSGAADVARIVSEIREKLKIKPTKSGDPQEEGYRLMQAVTSFLSNAARVQPLLIILEDLHDADKGTLEMLTYVSRNLGKTRLLIVGTYRDVEVDRAHPLSASLAELRRVTTYDRVVLRGLNADEVQRMMNVIAGHDVPWGLAETVHRQTEGNPLFVQEVLRYLRESGLVTGDYRRWQPAGQTQLEMSIPEGLRDVIGKRLSFLSEGCNRILSIAAVIGREFRLDVLQRVASVAEDELFNALREARAAVVVEERSTVGAAVTYRFTHTFFRQTMYEEMIAPERIRTHQQVARVLEETYAARLEEHAAELAEHFSYSSDPSDLAKVVSYGEMAAQRALEVYAFAEAVRLLEQALKVQELYDPENKTKRCDLLLALGEALRWTGQSRHVLDIEAPAALKLAEDTGDNERASMVCQQAIETLFVYGYSSIFGTDEGAQWAEQANRYAKPDTVGRFWADMSMGARQFMIGHGKTAVRLVKSALDLARRLDDPELFTPAAVEYITVASAPQHVDERLHLADELTRASRKGGRISGAMWGYFGAGGAFLEVGQRERAENVWDEYQEWAKRTGQLNFVLQAMEHDIIKATIEGRFEDASKLDERIIALGEEMESPEFQGGYLRYLLFLGRNVDAYYNRLQHGFQDQWAHTSGTLCLAYLGRKDEVAVILEQSVLTRPDVGSLEDETPSWFDIIMLEAAVLAEQREAAELLLSRLARSGVHTSGTWIPTCAARHLGAAAALLNRPDEALTHYHEAIRVSTEMRFRPELALTRLQLAELLLEHYPKERAEALEHLNFAIAEFRDMKMRPSLERALKHKEILGA